MRRRLGAAIERFLIWLHVLATPEESARYSRVDDELRRKGQ